MIETLFIGMVENAIKVAVNNNGESDGVCKVLYLDGLNKVMSLADGLYTDVLSAHIGVDGLLSFLASDDGDKHQTFVNIGELPMEVVAEIFNKIYAYEP
jgi:hypothetical protein